jgi:hypothetical protein
MSKYDEGKYQPTLLYPSFIRAVAKVRQYGINKYGKSEDWRTTEPIRHFDALIRHVLAHMEGEYTDKESGLPHLYHAAANIMFEIERIEGKIRARHSVKESIMLERTCPRCQHSDDYPICGVYPCTTGCGNMIET